MHTFFLIPTIQLLNREKQTPWVQFFLGAHIARNPSSENISFLIPIPFQTSFRGAGYNVPTACGEIFAHCTIRGIAHHAEGVYARLYPA